LYRSQIDLDLKKELIARVKDIIKDFDLPKKHKDVFEEMFYSIAKAAQLYHLERWELMSVARTINEMIGSLEMFSTYRDNKKVSIYGSARTKKDDPEYILARDFAKLMVDEDFYVITGAGPGIMEAGHEGAGKEKSFGLNITLPFEQQSNPIIHGDIKDFSFRYFFVRKLMFIKESHALVACPGGYGTLDELYETLTLIQNGKSTIVPIILMNAPGSSYWKKWNDFVEEEFLGKDLISKNDTRLYSLHTDAKTARDEIITFYKNFDSYRYWKQNQLIIRVKKDFSLKDVAKMSAFFSEMVKDGNVKKIEQKPFFDKDVQKYKDMYYLGVDFEDKDYGALRSLINEINKY
jgi:uncharacterized protein (TIGR00730 family)